VAFEQAGPAGPRLVAYQEGAADGQVISLPGVDVPTAELALSAKPSSDVAGDTYVFAIPLVPGLRSEWLEFCAALSGPRSGELQAQGTGSGLPSRCSCHPQTARTW